MGGNLYEEAKKLAAFEFVQRKKEEGLARQTGFSFHGAPEVLEQILADHPEVDFVQLQINYLDWDDPVVQSRKNYEVARAHGKPVLIMEPIKGSSLVNLPEAATRTLAAVNPDMSAAAWALRFCASLEGVEIVYSGMTTLAQVEENCAIMARPAPLSSAELAALRQAAAIVRENTAIPCTNCRYCEPECPKNIDIPDYFSLYNDYKRLKTVSHIANQFNYYNHLSMTRGKAGDCIGCGACEKACPQHIAIRGDLKKVAQVFEH